MAKTKQPALSAKSKLKMKKLKSTKVKKPVKAVNDKSLSPVKMKSKSKVRRQSPNQEPSQKVRGRPSSKTSPQAPEKSSGVKIIDIKEIKAAAEKILREKKQNSLLVDTGSLRTSLRKKTLSSPVNSPSPPTSRGHKLIQTISDGPTLSLLSQNQIIQKSLPKKLKNIQKELLKKQKSDMIKKAQLVEKKSKKEELESLRNQKIIEKLSKLLLKKKVLTKVQLKALMRGQSEFKIITLFAGLLKQSKKAVLDGTLQGPKNQWNVSSKEDEEMEEGEEDSFEMVDDEDQDKTYEPPSEETKHVFPRLNNIQTGIPFYPQRAAIQTKVLPNYRSKKNRLGEESVMLDPIEGKHRPIRAIANLADRAIANLAESDEPIFLSEKYRNRKVLRYSRPGNVSTSQTTDQEPEESIQSISAMIEQTQDSQESQTPGSIHCEVCNKSFKQKGSLKTHLKSWTHEFNERYQSFKNITNSRQATRENKLNLMSSIKQEMLKTMTSSLNLNDSKAGECRIFNRDGNQKFIIDAELNFSLVVDSLNLILTNDIEDDDDAYDTLQMAIGASDADMEILKDLAGQTIIADYVYDNQNPESTAAIFDANESAVLFKDFRFDTQDIDLETRAMGCPSTECDRTFFGTVGLQTHIKHYHRNETFLQKKTSFRYILGPDPLNYVCFVCKEMFPSSQSRDSHVQEKHVVNMTKNNEAKAKLIDTFREILEFTLRKCVANAEARKKKTLEKLEGNSKEEDEGEDDEYDELTLLGGKFVRKLRATEDGCRAYDLLVQLVNPTVENGDFVNLLVVKLHTILGKVVRSTLLPISNEIVISSRQQHNVFNSDSRERRYMCPICDLRFLNHVMRNHHLSAHPEVTVKVNRLTDEVIDPAVVVEADETAPSEETDSRGSNSNQTVEKESVLNELKMRVLGKMEKRIRAEKLGRDALSRSMMDQATQDLADEEEMMAIEEEYLNDQEKALLQPNKNLTRKNWLHKADTPQKSILQKVIHDIKSTITPHSPQPSSKPFIKVNNNFKCLQCDRIFIREDEVYHHNRLEHSTSSLASKLEDMRKKSHDAASESAGISPIKPVQIITTPVSTMEQSSTAVEGQTELAPLLTRKELEKVPAPISTEETLAPDDLFMEVTEEYPEEEEEVTKVVKIGDKELILQRLTRTSGVTTATRQIIKNSEGRVDRDSPCLIKYNKASPVKVSSLSSQEEAAVVVSTPCNTKSPKNSPACQSPASDSSSTTPLIKNPIASKLVSKLRSELSRKLASSPLTVATASSSTGDENESLSSPGQVILGTLNNATKLKRGPRAENIPEEVRLTALAQLRALALTAQEQKASKRKRRRIPDEDFFPEMEDMNEEDGGVLLTNSSSWRRVAEVEKDWETSDEEEEDEVPAPPPRVTRRKRQS